MTDEAPNDQPEIEIIEKELPPQRSETEILKSELAENRNKLLRALADFDNYKKRSALEREQFVQFANESIISEILPVLDGFGRAIESAEQTKASDEMIKGIALIKRQLEDVLK